MLLAVAPGATSELTALGTPANGVCKVADFGLSRAVGSKDYYRMRDESAPIPIRWMAPETLRDGTSDTKGDVWSYGVFLWEVYTLGNRPYPELSNGEIQAHIEGGARLPQPKLCPTPIYQLMSGCWSLLPAIRPSFDAVAEAVGQLHQPYGVTAQHHARDCPF